jgi:hypothetical protein
MAKETKIAEYKAGGRTGGVRDGAGAERTTTILEFGRKVSDGRRGRDRQGFNSNKTIP